MRSDSKKAYVCEFQVYTGREGGEADVGLGGKVVTNISRDLVWKTLTSLHGQLFQWHPPLQTAVAELPVSIYP